MMRTPTLAVLALLVGTFAFNLVVELLNRSRLVSELPEEFRGVYDPRKYQEALAYQGESQRFGLIYQATQLLALVAFVCAGGFERLDHAARSLGRAEIATGLVFAGALGLLKVALRIPFSAYDTFVIEEKYGFNKTTPRTFAADLLKGGLLGAAIGAPLLAGLIYFFERAGSAAWLYAWLTVTGAQVCLTFLAPALIMPLFNKFTPIPDGDLKAAIERYCEANRFTLGGIFTMDSSKRSTKGNAFFTGFGRLRKLVFFDTLVEKQTVEELTAIFAHEVGHYKLGHIPRFMAVSVLSTGVMLFALSLVIREPVVFAAFRMEHASVYAGLIFAGILYAPAIRILSMFGSVLSRKAEFEADEFSARTFGKPEAMVSALKKLSIDNLSHLTPHPLKVFMDYSHPPVLQRIEALRLRR